MKNLNFLFFICILFLVSCNNGKYAGTDSKYVDGICKVHNTDCSKSAKEMDFTIEEFHDWKETQEKNIELNKTDCDGLVTLINKKSRELYPNGFPEINPESNTVEWANNVILPSTVEFALTEGRDCSKWTKEEIDYYLKNCQECIMARFSATENNPMSEQLGIDVENVLFSSVFGGESERSKSASQSNAWQCRNCGTVSRSLKEPSGGDFGGMDGCTDEYGHKWEYANTNKGWQCRTCGNTSYLLKEPSGGDFGGGDGCSGRSDHSWRQF
jgi:hypothetical protein